MIVLLFIITIATTNV